MRAVWIALFCLCSTLGGAERVMCTPYFSTENLLAERLIQLIDREKKSIQMAIFNLTHLGIAKALIRAQERGVRVEVIIDPQSIRSRSSIHRLKKEHVPLYVWDYALRGGEIPKTTRPLMHDKFCIFGGERVWTGSFNFTNAAAKNNRENAVLIESEKIAGRYFNEFTHLKLKESRSFSDYIARNPRKKLGKKLPNQLR